MADKKKPTATTGRDAKRNEAVDVALGRLAYRSFFVDKVDEANRKIGRERTVVSTYQDGLIIDSGELVVSGIAYDGATSDLARPTRLVLDLDDARKLQAQLGLWITALESTAT